MKFATLEANLLGPFSLSHYSLGPFSLSHYSFLSLLSGRRSGMTEILLTGTLSRNSIKTSVRVYLCKDSLQVPLPGYISVNLAYKYNCQVISL